MQVYLHRLVRLRARAPDVAESSIINAAITGLSLGPCGEYLEHRRPKTLNSLFEIMQEYCISDKGKRRRIEEMNEMRSRNCDRPKPHQPDQAKTTKVVNTVSVAKPATPGLRTTEEGGATEATPIMVGGKTPAENKKSLTAVFTAETKAIG